MVQTKTVEEFQNSQIAEAESNPPFNLSTFAQRMVAERQADDAEADRGDPFEKLDLTAEPGEAYGHLEARLRAWIEERGVWALEPEIRRMADQLLADAEQRRPATETTYTVDLSGNVNGYTVHEVSAELPGMPPTPEPINGLRVPSDSQFVDGWTDSTSLVQRAIELIKRHPDELEHLHGMPMSFLWRQRGGKSRGRPNMGATVKAGGLLKHFAASTFCIWLAADHVRAAGYGDRQIEALLFRQLLAAGVAEVDEDTGRGGGATLVPPEIQAYEAEIRVYGAWEPAHKSAARTFQQVSLFDGPTAQEEGQYLCVRCEGERTTVRRGLCRDCTNDAASEWLEREYPPADDEPTCDSAQVDMLEGEPALDLSGAGILIHDDGTPFTAEEIAAQEAAELRDDPAEFDDDDSDLEV